MTRPRGVEGLAGLVCRWKRSAACFGIAASLSSVAHADVVDEMVSEIAQENLTWTISNLEGDRSSTTAKNATIAFLRAELEAHGYVVGLQAAGASKNVIARLEGAGEGDDLVVLGAHFDTVYGCPGADDNASGVAAVLEIARVLAGYSFDATIDFVFFAEEETTYEGSEAYAFSVDKNVIAAVVLDMIGYRCSTPGCQMPIPGVADCMYVDNMTNVGDWIGVLANVDSRDLMDAYVATAMSYVPELPIATLEVEGVGHCFPDVRRSDHKSFWDKGYPAMLMGDGGNSRSAHYHEHTDTLETLDMDFATTVTRSIAAHVAIQAGPTPVVSIPLMPIWMHALLALSLVAAARVVIAARI